MAVEAHAGFEAQRVARAEAAGNHFRGFAGVHQVVPKLFGMLGGEINLEAIFAGVAGAGDQAVYAADFAESEMIVADGVERERE